MTSAIVDASGVSTTGAIPSLCSHRCGGASRLRLGLSEHDDRAGRENLGASATAPADLVNDILEMVQIANPDAGEGVGISGERE